MALKQKSLILYGFQITELNSSLDFQTSMGGPIKMATLRLGFYSLTDLLLEVARAMTEADATKIYTASANRNVSGGLENRVSISATGGFLSLLFLSGPRTATTVAPLLGYMTADYTGSTLYTSFTSAGTPLIPDYIGYNYAGPENQKKVFGSVNISASGVKEAVVFQIQNFIDVEFKYEPDAPRDDPSNYKVRDQWAPFFEWAIQQRAFEFTPEIPSYNIVYNVTLEKTAADGKGLAFKLTEQLPQFPDRYTTGVLQFRVKV